MTSKARVLPFALAAISVQLAAQAPERVSVLVHLAPGAGPASHGGSEKIIGVLKQMEAGRKVANPARDLGASEATIYTWRSKYSGLG